MTCNICIIFNMSVDVFGRNLKREESSSRGPPGIGYKLTTSGQYDIENKRLCNVADPKDSHDAINLGTLQRTSQANIENVLKLISELRDNLQSLNKNLEEHRAEVDKHLRTHDTDIINLEDLINTGTKNIYTVALEDDDGSSERSGRGAPQAS